MLVRPLTEAHAYPRLRSEMDQLFERFFGDYEPYRAWDRSGLRRSPAINAWQDAECLFVEAELPGVTSEDLELSVAGDELTIKGMRRVPAPVEGTIVHRRERGAGTFARLVHLPMSVDEERVEAKFENGVLTITLPKAQAAPARRVPVQTPGADG